MTFSFVASLFLSILLVTATKLNQTNLIINPLTRVTAIIQRPIVLLRQQKDSLINFLLAVPSLYQRNKALLAENESLKVKVKTLSESIADQELISKIEKPSWQIQPIKLISIDRLLTFTSHNFANLKPGQPVASGNSLVGLVNSIQPPIIKVTPLTSGAIKIAAQLETGAKGGYTFKNNAPHIIDLPSNTSFNPQTSVLTLPTSLIPENLVIGRVEKITTDLASPTKEATLTLESTVSEADSFYIITQP